MALEARSRARRRTCKSTDFGATAVASSVDLLEEILMRLPAKPLLRFKCVSKQWYSIISEPQFTIDHAQRNPNPLLGFLFRGQPEPSGPDPIFFFISIGANRKNGGNPKVLSIPKIEIHHLCNGLLCYSEPHRDNPQLTSYYVCNSASGQSKRMRVLGTPSIKKFMAVNLAFDPVKSPFYDVIFVSETSASELFHLIKIDIFSSKTQSWRPTSKGLFIVPYDVDFANGVYWNGAIYWYHRKKNSLAYFDFEDDCLKKLQMPSVSQGSYPMSFDYFGESGGHLHLVGTCRPRTTLFTVFEMEKDRSGWFVKCNGDLGALATAFPKMVTHKSSRRYAFSPVSVLRGEEEEEEVSIVLAIPGSVVRYNVKGKTSKKLSGLPKNYTLNEFAAQNFPLKALQYIETLASI